MQKKDLYYLLKDKYSSKWNPKILNDARRLQSGEPLDYVIGWTPFLNCKIDLSQKPLIPRPETEYWAEKCIEWLQKKYRNKPVKILDAFAGSGCIGITILKHLPNARVDFSDNSPAALKQIKINLRLNHIPARRAKIRYSNVLKNIRIAYDCIAANPPYIPAGRKLPESVKKYEPRQALFAGRDGLYFIKKFLKQVPKHIKNGGSVWMEFDSAQKSAIQKILKKLKYPKWKFFKDQYGKWRYLVLAV